MKIKHLKIENFRILRHVDIDLEDGINTFIGINGAGKSTILHAIRILLSWFVARMQAKTGHGLSLTDRDISHGEEYCKLELTLDNGVKWKLFKRLSAIRKPQTEKSDLSEMNAFIVKLYDNYSVKDEQLRHLPMIAYYGVDRAVTEVPNPTSNKHLLRPLDVYKSFREEKISFRSFFDWFKEREDIENENYRNHSSRSFESDPQLDAVRLAIKSTVSGYSNLHVRRSPRAIIINKGGEEFNFAELSDGEKCYITLVGDIARRMAMANPQSQKALDAPAIVMIDEIDLHLHPKWQQNVVESLTKAFPNIQFIITTHSPFIVSSLRKTEDNQMIVLDNGELSRIDNDVYGASVEDVLLGVFGLTTVRNTEVQKRIDHIWKMLQNPSFDQDKVEKEIEWLRKNMDISDSLFARFELQKALLKRRNEEVNK